MIIRELTARYRLPDGLRFTPLNLVQWSGILLLFTPKINLVSVEGQTAGLRIDDVLLLVLLAYTALKFLLPKQNRFSRLELSVLLFLGLLLLSNLINLLFFRRSNPLYTIRYVEYFVFFYVGYFCSREFDVRRIAVALLVVNALVMLGQKFNLVGGFTSVGFGGDVSDRVIGLTGGPWEIGLIINYLFIILLYGRESRPVPFQRGFVYFILTAALILLTGSRMPALAHVLIAFFYFSGRFRSKTFFFSLAAGLGVALIFLLVTVQNPLVERSSNLFTFSNIQLFSDYYQQLNVDVVFTDFPPTPGDADSDMSWLMRISKWSFAIKFWTHQMLAWIVGVGPGLWGIALDGGWIRLLTETGLAGFFIYLMILRNVARLNIAMRLLLIPFAVNMLMIDIYLAYKCMALFFFLTGYYTRPGDFNHRVVIR